MKKELRLVTGDKLNDAKSEIRKPSNSRKRRKKSAVKNKRTQENTIMIDKLNAWRKS